MKNILFFVLLIFPLVIFAQETQPCIEYKLTGYTAHHPKTLPIFPGCESFKENHTLLNQCFGNKIAGLIADKLDMDISTNSQKDSYKVAVIIDVDFTGKLAMKLQERRQNSFEDLLEEKLNEISDETIGIIPAKITEGYCTNFKYKLPISFDLTDTRYKDSFTSLTQ